MLFSRINVVLPCLAFLICFCFGLSQARAELFVSSFFTNQILQFDETTGNRERVFATTVGNPNGLAIGPGPTGDLFVALGDRVVRFDGTTGNPTGETLGLFGTGTPVATDLIFGSGNEIFVVNDNQAFPAIHRFDVASNGSSGPNISDGGLNRPFGLTFSASGDLLVSNRATDEVLRYESSSFAFGGAFVTAGSGGLDLPTGLAFGPNGNLFVASGNTGEVLEYDATTGAPLGTFVTAGSGGLSGIQDIEFGPDGDLYAASLGTDEVLRFDGITGEFKNVAASGGGLDGPTYLAFRPVPEPSAIILSGVAIIILAAIRRTHRTRVKGEVHRCEF